LVHSQTQKATDRSGHKGIPGFSSYLVPLLLLTTIFFLNFVSRITLAPLLPSIEEDLGLSHGEAGAIFLMISLGYFITLVGSGFVSARITHRRTIILSSTAVGLALLGVSLSEGLWEIRAGFMVLGMATGFYLPSGIATLTSLVNPRDWGKAIAIHELGPNLSFVAAPLVSAVLMLWFSWRGVLAITGCTCLAAAMIFARFGSGGRFPGQAPGFSAFKTLSSEPAFWIMIFLFSLGIGSTLGIFTMLPLYLVTEHEITPTFANTLVGLSRIPALGMAFLAGWANDRLGPGRTMGIAFLLTGVTTILLGIAPNSWVMVFVFVQPLAATCFFPPGLAALSSIGPPEARNLAVSFTVPVAFILGSGAIPAGIGLMADAGSFPLGIILVGGLILTGAILSLRLRLSSNSCSTMRH